MCVFPRFDVDLQCDDMAKQNTAGKPQCNTDNNSGAYGFAICLFAGTVESAGTTK